MPTEPQRRERQTTLWESDGRIVPLKLEDQSGGSKPGNAGAGKAARPTRETARTPTVPSDGASVLNRLDRITKRAEQQPEATFDNLYSLLTYELLWFAFRKLKRDKAPGVDGVTVDQWFEHEVRPRLHGEAYLIRYADDFICAFEEESDARRFQAVLRKRLARFSLELAEEKTKLLRFGRFARRECQRWGERGPGTFDFLGFTHYCGHSRAGKFKLKRKTATKKLRAKFQALKDWFRVNLTTPTMEVWHTLCAKLQGHFHYYNVNDNWRSLVKYREAARRLALRWLRRRSQNSGLSWDAYNAYLRQHSLPIPGRIVDLIAMARGAR